MQTTEKKEKSVFLRYAKKMGFGPKSSFVVAMLSIGFGIATYKSLTLENTEITRLLLIADVVFVFVLAVIVGQRLTRMWRRSQKGAAGSLMRRRVLRLFSLIAVAPALMVAMFSALFFNIYFQKHFSEPVNQAVGESMVVAEAYIKEHIQNIRADLLAMAAQLNRAPLDALNNRKRFDTFLTTQVNVRGLSEAVVINRKQQIISRSELSFVMEFDKLSAKIMNEAAKGDVVVVAKENDDRVRALVRLDRLLDSYLYVGRFIDPIVLGHLEKTRKAAADYETLRNEGFGIQIQFAVIFIVVSLMVVLAAVWFGLAISSRLVGPIEGLVDAAEKISDGDLNTRVDESLAYDEMGTLTRAFNRMTSQLSYQRDELTKTNDMLDERRRFMETVLAGVTAGVIGLDKDGNVTIPNRTATRLLNITAARMIGKPFEKAAPEMAFLLNEVRLRPNRIAQSQINLDEGGVSKNLLVRVAAEISETGIQGFVVTLDEITDLVSAQRIAAWGDIARRIAHEIKNPLTPIQLSAERLKRKYRKEITSDTEIFDKCTDTIIRQVGDIGQMVDEFSAFARMPAPDMKNETIAELLEQAVFLQKVAHPNITFDFDPDWPPSDVLCDAAQINRVFTNLLQNACDAIEGRSAEDKKQETGQIRIKLKHLDKDVLKVSFTDNGRGLPKENRDRLLEPYVTHREKGTGLGLAIVSKIMEEHGGSLRLEDAEGRGAKVTLSFKLNNSIATDNLKPAYNEMK